MAVPMPPIPPVTSATRAVMLFSFPVGSGFHAHAGVVAIVPAAGTLVLPHCGMCKGRAGYAIRRKSGCGFAEETRHLGAARNVLSEKGQCRAQCRQGIGGIYRSRAVVLAVLAALFVES